MRRSPVLPAVLRIMKLWRERPGAPAGAEHGVQLVEPLLVPFLCLRDAGDLAEIQDTSGLPLAALTQAMREVSGDQSRLCGPPSALSTNIKRFL